MKECEKGPCNGDKIRAYDPIHSPSVLGPDQRPPMVLF